MYKLVEISFTNYRVHVYDVIKSETARIDFSDISETTDLKIWCKRRIWLLRLPETILLLTISEQFSQLFNKKI